MRIANGRSMRGRITNYRSDRAAEGEGTVGSKARAEGVTPTYRAAAIPALADYGPAWLGNLADNVTLEGSMMDGAVQGADAVRTLLVYIRSLYDRQQFRFAGPYGENGFLAATSVVAIPWRHAAWRG